jgi:hypothetical protein
MTYQELHDGLANRGYTAEEVRPGEWMIYKEVAPGFWSIVHDHATPMGLLTREQAERFLTALNVTGMPKSIIS